MPSVEATVDLDQVQDRISVLEASIQRFIRGKPETVKAALIAIISRGHMLIEDVPGVGKTTLAAALARSVELSFRRIQFTSDLLPTDILGVSVFDKSTGGFTLKPGPIFANVILADEINRATPKSQSALLEAMSEARVTIDGHTYLLPTPFIVIATQNPYEYRGTFPLPENQLDRFAMRVSIGYPDAQSEKEILMHPSSGAQLDAMKPVLSRKGIMELQDMAEKVHMDSAILDYLLAIVHGTRDKGLFELGVSPRGAIALKSAAQARALLDGRDYCIPDDIKELAVQVLSHRVITKEESALGRGTAEEVLSHLLERIDVPL